MNTLFSSLRIAEVSSMAHLNKVEVGYEKMDHYTVDFKKEGKALHCIDFIQGEATETVYGSFFFFLSHVNFASYICVCLMAHDRG